jgi:hypothetical protein
VRILNTAQKKRKRSPPGCSRGPAHRKNRVSAGGASVLLKALVPKARAALTAATATALFVSRSRACYQETAAGSCVSLSWSSDTVGSATVIGGGGGGVTRGWSSETVR